ncbi:hypothetical protein MN608_00666 [Microdochium nivale]|nr:hypothetical protein MN608_00666 [Microdochium nivale]
MPPFPRPNFSTGRLSLHDLEDDEFFSAPQTRHVSIDPVKIIHRDIDVARPHYESLVPVCEATNPLAERPSAANKWMHKFTIQFGHEHEPPHDHLSWKALRRLIKGHLSNPEIHSFVTGDSGRALAGHVTRESVMDVMHQVSRPSSQKSDRQNSVAVTQLERSLRQDQAARAYSYAPGLTVHEEDEQNADSIVNRIQEYLAARRYSNNDLINVTSVDDENFQPSEHDQKSASEPGELYLVRMSDISVILEIVITGMRDSKQQRRKPKQSKPIVCSSHAQTAPPATTYSSVHPTFNYCLNSTGSNSMYSGSDKATIVSRQSVTEVD